jgi:CHAT domain-containing protein
MEHEMNEVTNVTLIKSRRWPARFKFCLVFTIFLFCHSAHAADNLADAEKKREDGLILIVKGDFEQAIPALLDAASIFDRLGDVDKNQFSLFKLGEAYQAIGKNRKAAETFENLLAIAHRYGNLKYEVFAEAGIGSAMIFNGDVEKAEGHISRSVILAESGGDAESLAHAKYNLGDLRIAQKKYDDAILAYGESVAQAVKTPDRLVAMKALSKSAFAMFLAGRYTDSYSRYRLLVTDLISIENSHEKAFILTHIGKSLTDLRDRIPDSHRQLTETAISSFTEALKVARYINDERALTYVYGYWGRLHQMDRSYHDALKMTRKAIFSAQLLDDHQSLLEFNWQAGRIFNALKLPNEAIRSYRAAVKQSEAITTDISSCGESAALSFRKILRPMLMELVDTLLRKADSTLDVKEAQSDLLEARETAEVQKNSDMQDYFQDNCVNIGKDKTSLEQISKDVAVIYSIALSDRIELLVSTARGIKKYTINEPSSTLIGEVKKFRMTLEKRTTREYLVYAKKMYDYLFRPYRDELKEQGITTVVFVPDSALRMIPLAALHDGEKFLVSEFAVVVSPGLRLADPQKMMRESMTMLTGAITESVHGFPSLPNVAMEVESIQKMFKGRVLKDGEFLISNIQRELDNIPYPIVHIASHGQFEGDVTKTFLLTYDGKLTMNMLERIISSTQYRKTPVELLTLSACQTAVGDERASLGLAGVALKAGARSALASLWFINDVASSVLVEKFYKRLQDASISKAKALQEAQLSLLADKRYQHPAYWAPFLLIGNWQ